jgi:hypothetical protein
MVVGATANVTVAVAPTTMLVQSNVPKDCNQQYVIMLNADRGHVSDELFNHNKEVSRVVLPVHLVAQASTAPLTTLLKNTNIRSRCKDHYLPLSRTQHQPICNQLITRPGWRHAEMSCLQLLLLVPCCHEKSHTKPERNLQNV